MAKKKQAVKKTVGKKKVTKKAAAKRTKKSSEKKTKESTRGVTSSMSKTAALALLKQNKNERGVKNWNKMSPEKRGQLKSFGIGLTQLRKLAKQIGRDHELALKLWASDYYDAKVVGLLIDDPKQLTREQVETQVDHLHGGYLAHVFSSCDATLAKAPFAFKIACDWMGSDCEVRRRCAYGLLYELSKKPKVEGMDDNFLLERIEHIQKEIHAEDMWVREAMNTALMGIGKRNQVLNRAAIKAAKKIGPVDIDYGDDNQCEPLDVLKHLTSDYVSKKWQR